LTNGTINIHCSGDRQRARRIEVDPSRSLPILGRCCSEGSNAWFESARMSRG